MALRTYDPKELTVIFGTIILRGFAEEQVTIAFDNPLWEMVIGADGEATRVKSNDGSATITCTLQQSSPSNDELSTVYLLDRGSNAGLRPMYIKDNLGSTLYTAASAFIENLPEAAFGKTQNDRAWTFKTDNLIAFLGGNAVAT